MWFQKRFTVLVVEEVIRVATNYDKKWLVLLTLDIRNVFNTASRDLIINKLVNKNIPPYLINIIRKYLLERKTMISSE